MLLLLIASQVIHLVAAGGGPAGPRSLQEIASNKIVFSTPYTSDNLPPACFVEFSQDLESKTVIDWKVVCQRSTQRSTCAKGILEKMLNEIHIKTPTGSSQNCPELDQQFAVVGELAGLFQSKPTRIEIREDSDMLIFHPNVLKILPSFNKELPHWIRGILSHFEEKDLTMEAVLYNLIFEPPTEISKLGFYSKFGYEFLPSRVEVLTESVDKILKVTTSDIKELPEIIEGMKNADIDDDPNDAARTARHFTRKQERFKKLWKYHGWYGDIKLVELLKIIHAKVTNHLSKIEDNEAYKIILAKLLRDFKATLEVLWTLESEAMFNLTNGGWMEKKVNMKLRK